MIEIIHKYYKKFSFSLLLNIIFFILCYLLCYCKWRTNDDVFIKLIVSGGYGSPDYHTIFISSIFGRLLSFLYNVCSFIPWYEIIQYGLLIFSFSILMNIFLNDSPIKEICVLSIIVISFQTYVRPQFSITTSIITVSSYIVFYYYLRKNRSNLFLISGLILITFAMIMRLKQFLACSAISVFCMLPLITEYIKTKKIDNKFLLIILYSVLILVSTITIEKNDYSTLDWQKFNQYNYLRSELIDNGYPDYEENIEIYNKLGIDENALNLYKNWNFDDQNILSIDSMSTLVNIKEKKTIDLNMCLTFAITFINHLFTEECLLFINILLLLSIFVFVFLNKNSKESIISICCLIVFTIICFFYVFFIRGAYLSRLSISYLSVLLLCVLSQINSTKYDNKTINKYLSIIILALFIIYNKQYLSIYNQKDIDFEKNNKEVINMFNNDSEHIYICKVSSYPNEYDILFDTTINHNNANITSFGECDTCSPLKNSILNKYDIINPYKDIVNNNKAFVVDNDIDSTIKYIRKNYANNAEYVYINTYNGYNVYRIVSK